MSGTRKRILIIGGGAVGPKVASRARRLAPTADIKMVEAGKLVSYGACGMPYYVSGDIKTADELLVRTPEYFRKHLDVDVLLETRAVSVDRGGRTVLCRDSGGREFPLPYDTLVLATGASPFVPPLEGRDLSGVFKLKDIPDMLAIADYVKKEEPRKAAIIGAGLIGLEMAEAFRAKGMAVTVVEMLDWPLPALLDEEMASILSRHLDDQGVRLLLSQKAQRFEGTQGGRVRRLVTAAEEVDCDIALLSIGVRPETSLAAQAGLALGPTRAIAVNERLQTSDPAIYSGGDCVECRHLVTGKPVFVPLGSTANKHGRVIGTNVAGGNDTFAGVAGTAVAKVFDVAVGRTGLSEREALQAGFNVVSSIVSPTAIAHYYPGAKRVTLKLVADAANGRVLGAQCAGQGEVAKRIDVIATAVSARMDVKALADMDLAYAPPFSPAMDAIHNAANVIRNKMAGIAKGISPLELKKKMNDPDLIILDVRTDREWKLSRIDHPNVRHVPMAKLLEMDGGFCEGKEVVTLCHSSVRAYQAQKLLERKGCKNVKFLDGSLSAWPYELKE